MTAVRGDLTRQDVDAIVNPTDTAVRGGGGLDAAVHAAGGPDILEDCISRFPHGLSAGEAGWTTAGRLPARWVIHTVSPTNLGGSGDLELLRSCYRRAMQVADEVGARSLAFPLVGAGANRWPRQVTIDAAIDTVLATASRVEEVRLVAPDEDGYLRSRAQVLLRCPPTVSPGTVGELFERPPVQYGLRGDPYLWRELRARFAGTPLPQSPLALRPLIESAIGEVLGSPVSSRASAGWYADTASVHVPAFDPGHGMSAGTVHVPWWSHTALPILLDRFEARRESADAAGGD